MTAGTAADAPFRMWLRVFATPADEPRSRRASDVTLLLTMLIALAAISAAAIPRPAFARALERLMSAVPDFLDAVWQIALDATTVLALVLVGAAIVRRRWSVVRDLLLAAVVTFGAWLLLGRTVVGSWPDAWAAFRAAAPPAWYPALRVALPAAIVITASPHVVLPLRRLGRWFVAASAIAVTVLGAASPLGSIAGLMLATAAAAAVHLACGSCAGRPGLDVVTGALRQLGVAAIDLVVAERQQAGLFLVSGSTADGAALDVKVYGRDAHDSAVLSTLWRTAWYREPGAPLRVGRLQQVEHEAFLTLLAAQAGVPTDGVVTAGATSGDDAILVLRRSGRPLTADDAGEATVDQLWDLVATLHGAGIAHGRVDPQHLFVDAAGRLGIRDFRGSSAVVTPAQRNTDRVQALVTSVSLVGPERAVVLARRHLDDDAVADCLALLQPAVLTTGQQRAVKEGDVDLAALRTSLAASIDAEVPALQQLRRLSPTAILRVVLPAIAVIALLSLVAGLDFAELRTLLADASWWLLAAGLIAAQLPRFTQAVSTIGASPVPLPLGPVYALQLAVSYINIAIPTAAARVAVNIRFFQRHGMAPGTAMASGALDGFSGFIVQSILLVVLLVFTSASLDLDLRSAVERAGPLVLIVVAIVVVLLAIVVLVAPLRRFVVRWVRQLAGEAWAAVRGLRSPRRLAMLFGGNLASEVLFAAVLGMFVAALGYHVGLGELLLTNISVALLAGLMPVPGGIGVAEGGLTIGLINAGVPEEAAFAAVLLYRMATFYLPPIWGYVAMRWLERNEHL